MKNLLTLIVLLLSFHMASGQNSNIELATAYGSENKELRDILRFQGIEIIKLNFSGSDLIGKEYRILIKEYTNGRLAKTDTIMDSSKDEYIPTISDSVFGFKYFVKTELNNTIKMNFQFERFSSERHYDIKATEDQYALHDFLGGNKTTPIKWETSNTVLGYFLPYIDTETGWKKYCEVSGSKIEPEAWGTEFDIPNYFLVEIVFHEP